MRRPDPHTDHLDAAGDLRRHATAQQILQALGDRVRIHALQRRLDRIDVDVERVAGRVDAVADIDHAGDFGYAVGHLVRGLRQRLWIIAEDFYFHRLRHCRQVADQILHQLRHFYSQSRYIVFDLLADIVHHLFDRTARARFQADEKVALVRFAQATAKASAGTARISIDVRRGAHDLFDLPQQAVGFGQRGARLAAVIEHEAAFVHRRHEARTDRAERQRT